MRGCYEGWDADSATLGTIIHQRPTSNVACDVVSMSIDSPQILDSYKHRKELSALVTWKLHVYSYWEPTVR